MRLIKNFEKYFMAHQYMHKIFHDLHKNPPAPLSYILNVRSLKFTTLISLCSSMVLDLTSIFCTFSLGKPASGISNNYCENSVTLLDNKLFKSTSKLLLNSELCTQIIHSFLWYMWQQVWNTFLFTDMPIGFSFSSSFVPNKLVVVLVKQLFISGTSWSSSLKLIYLDRNTKNDLDTHNPFVLKIPKDHLRLSDFVLTCRPIQLNSLYCLP